MAKRKPDPRVVTSALPPLCRVKGEAPFTKLHRHCVMERCDHTDTIDGISVRCESSPTVTRSVPATTKTPLRTMRVCSEHYADLHDPAEELLAIALKSLEYDESGKRSMDGWGWKPEWFSK